MNYLQNYLYNYLDDVYGLVLEYVDAEYGLWVTWLLTPLLITFLLPAVLILLIYTSAIIFHVYRLYRLRLVEGVQNDWRNAARLAVCALWDAHGWLWHGYEISGLENIPEGPCLIIYYHGALPVDMYYFIGRMYLLKRCMVHTVADRFMFKIPGWSIMLDGLCVIPGTVQTCTGILRAGNKLAISPGGVYEAQFGDHRYELKWKSRIGFAKVALEAKVPIVPMFTQNVREAFRTVRWLRWVWLRIYQATRVPLAPVYGGFPVKLLTHVGAPIPYDASLTPQQLQLKVASAIEELVEEHQRVPGSILRALAERVYRVPKKMKKPTERLKTANGSCGNGQLLSPQDKVTAPDADDKLKPTEQCADKTGSHQETHSKESDNNEDHMTKITDTKGVILEASIVKDDIIAKCNGLADRDTPTEGKDSLTDVKDSLAENKDRMTGVKNVFAIHKETLADVKDSSSEDKGTLTDVKKKEVNTVFKEKVSDSKMKVS